MCYVRSLARMGDASSLGPVVIATAVVVRKPPAQARAAGTQKAVLARGPAPRSRLWTGAAIAPVALKIGSIEDD